MPAGQEINAVPDSLLSKGVPELPDSLLALLPDSLASLPLDSLIGLLPDSILSQLPDSLLQAAVPTSPYGDNNSITSTIKYSAKDSIITDVINQKVYLYGDAKIDYGTIKLEAEHIVIDYIDRTLTADYVLDSAGRKKGLPIFADGDEAYTTNHIKYNFDTKKAYIRGIVTQQGEAIMHGDTVKKNERDELFVKRARYTTCNLADPHFHIQASKLKLIPNNKMVAGPFRLYFNDVPTPLGLPFGMFPVPKKRASGVVFPTYGEQKNRGFFLKDGGYFFAINDYMNLQLTGEIYSKGGYGAQMSSNYIKRYKYNGNLSFSYNKFRSGQEQDSISSNDFWVRWSHSPQSRGSGRFQASVNAGTSSYNSRYVLDVQRNTTAQFTSNVSYSKSFTNTPFNMALSARHAQNINTNQVDLTLPDFSLNMNRIYPFRGKNGAGDTWYKKLNVGWTFNLSNRITNRLSGVKNEAGTDSIAAFNFETFPTLLENAQNGARHSIPISTSLRLFKYFTLSPNISYNEVWYLEKLNYNDWTEEDGVVTDTIQGFTRANWYSMSASLNSRLYGTFNFNKGNIQAIRHVLNTNMSFSYNPDFADPEQFDYYQDVVTNGNGTVQRRSRYQGFLSGGPPSGESQTLGISLGNTLEMKVASKSDTATTSKKVMLIENFGLSTGYNFAADSFNVNNVNLTLRTRIFNNKVNINMTGTLDPYLYLLDTIIFNENGAETVRQTRVNTLRLNTGSGLGQFNSAGLNVSTNLNPQAFQGARTEIPDESMSPEEQAQREFIAANPNMFVDFNIPWNLRLNYTLRYSRTGFAQPTVAQSVTFNGDVSLTDKWKIGFQSGYDLEKKGFTNTSIDIYRDLHCWEMSFYWVPFGNLQSYQFTIRAKSSILQDLKLNRRRNWNDF